VNSSISSLATALRLARSEATKRGEQVTVCARDPKAAQGEVACAPAGLDWSAGWIVFVDHGVRGRIDDGDVLIQVHQPTSRTTQVTATLRYITLQPTGISLSAASHFDFLPNGQVDAYGARRVCINKPGRLRELAAVVDCAA
jgi:type IV fimbrial biogenesis protein FimT